MKYRVTVEVSGRKLPAIEVDAPDPEIAALKAEREASIGHEDDRRRYRACSVKRRGVELMAQKNPPPRPKPKRG